MRYAAALLAVTILACGFAGAVRAEVTTVAADPTSGIKVEVEGWTGLSSPLNGRDVGLIPVTVTITNGSPADHAWTIRHFSQWSCSGVIPSARIVVPAGATGRTTLFVGCPMGTFNGGVLNFNIAGPGVSSSFHVDCWASNARFGGGGPKMPPSGISNEVHARQGPAFRGYSLHGNSLDMARAPDDWRGWSAFRNVLMTEAEWQGLTGGKRKAVFDWVATGGRAGVFVADRAADRLDRLGFPEAGPDGRRRVGAGEIVVMPWDGKNLEAKEVEAFLAGQRRFEETLLDYHPGHAAAHRPGRGGGYAPPTAAGTVGGWEPGFGRLFDRFGPRLLPVAAILTFLAVFGLVAGPLNVMVLAGKGRRSRMFWTTPAISLAATGLLLAMMFLRDGVGGAGGRRVLGLLAPGQNTLAVIQEQFSRTGVLPGSSFPIAEPAWLQPVGPLDPNDRLMEIDGRSREGDWFRSRSDQAFVATAVRPSRARIEVVAGADAAPPAVISSIEVPLDRVFVIDEEGRYWTAEDLGTGEKKPLVASDADAYAKWFATLEADAGPVRRQALTAVKNLRGHAYASSPQAAKLAVQTLRAIRWIDERIDFAGPYTRTGSR